MKIKMGEEAAFQALKECLEEIPFLEMADVYTVNDASRPYFRIGVRIQNRSLTILAEYKASGQPRLAREAALQIKHWLDSGQGDEPRSVHRSLHFSRRWTQSAKEPGSGNPGPGR